MKCTGRRVDYGRRDRQQLRVREVRQERTRESGGIVMRGGALIGDAMHQSGGEKHDAKAAVDDKEPVEPESEARKQVERSTVGVGHGSLKFLV